MSNADAAARKRYAAERARAFRARQREAGRPDDRTVDAAVVWAVSAQAARVAFSDMDRSMKEIAARVMLLDYGMIADDATRWLVRKGHAAEASRTAIRERLAERAREWRDHWQVREAHSP